MLRTSILLLALGLALSAPAIGQTQDAAAVESRATQLFVRGMTSLYVQDFEAAAALFEQVLALRPRDSAVLAALSEAHEGRGDLGAALFHAEEAVRHSPTEPAIHRQLADLKLRSGDLGGAVEALQSVIALTPRDAETLALLARVQQQAGEPEQALATYSTLLDLVGDSPTVHSRMMQLYRRVGDLEGALRATEALMRLDPDNVPLRRQAAELLLALDRPDEAMATLEALIEDAPDDAETAEALAALYRDRGDEASATRVLDEVDERAPASPEARFSRAISLFERSAADPSAGPAALRMIEDLADEGLLPTEGYFLLGEIRMMVGDYEGAAEALSAALDAHPAHPEGWAQLAAAQLQAGDAVAAVETLEDALLLFPGQYPLLRVALLANAEAGSTREALGYGREALDVLAEIDPNAAEERSVLLGTIGLLHMRTGDHAAADAAHAEALELDPENATVLNNWAYNLVERGDRLPEALEMVHAAVAAEPENVAFLDTLGWAYHATGDQDEAARWLERAVDLGRQQGTLRSIHLEHLGDVEQARGNSQAAVEHWEEALDLAPDDDELRSRVDRAR